jgi:hypothetical protein
VASLLADHQRRAGLIPIGGHESGEKTGMKRTIVLILAVIGLAKETFAQPMALPYTICATSDTWTRPSAAVQSRIWNDNRYKPAARTSYEWTHDFLLTEPDSASLSYHSENLSGLWTAPPRTWCPRRDGERGWWIELWALQHRVTMITIDGGVVTVWVQRQEAGYEIVQVSWPAFLEPGRRRLRVVAADGAVAAEWVETRPHMLTPVSAVK